MPGSRATPCPRLRGAARLAPAVSFQEPQRLSASKKLVQTALKLGISLAILAWVVERAWRDAQAAEVDLTEPPASWWLLAVAWSVLFAALVATIVRWYYLVRALGIDFRLSDAMRLGFLSYLFNFVSLGSVGGDLFKAVFIAKENPHRRAEAVATVVVDRVIGLYGLFVVATACVLATGQYASSIREVRAIARGTLLCTALGMAALVVLIVPGFTTGAVSEMLRGLPKVGRVIGKLIDAIRMYRRRPGLLLQTGLLSVGVHALTTLGVYLIARGIEGQVPSLTAHFVIVPLSMVASAAPLPFMGLGAFEGALDFLYIHVAGGAGELRLTSFAVLKIAFAYRAITILNAAVGLVVYAFSRREMAAVIEQAEAEAEADEAETADVPRDGLADDEGRAASSTTAAPS